MDGCFLLSLSAVRYVEKSVCVCVCVCVCLCVCLCVCVCDGVGGSLTGDLMWLRAVLSHKNYKNL